jgi:hypothetical protein
MTLNLNVLNNIREFLKRVKVEGLEAFALVEAYSAVQQEIALSQTPIPAMAAGVPFLAPGPGPTVDPPLLDPPLPANDGN